MPDEAGQVVRQRAAPELHEGAPRRVRHNRAWAGSLLVIGTVLAVVAIFAVWIQRQVLNTDNWTTTSTQLLQDGAIRSAVSGYLVDQLYQNVDVEGELRNGLPKQLAPLAGPAAGGLRTVAQDAINFALERPQVQGLWEQANRVAQTELLKLLNGGGRGISTDQGEVVLHLDVILGQLASRVGIGANLVSKIPQSAASLVILRSNQLRFAQTIAHALRPLAIIITLLALALLALAVLLARGWRREALRNAGLALVVAGAGVLALRSFAGQSIVDALAKTDSAKPAADAVWSISTRLLVQAATATLAYGIVIVLAAWLAGPSRVTTSVRCALAPYLREPGIAYAGLGVIVLLLVIWGPTPALRSLFLTLILVAFLVAGMEALRRRVAAEFPDAQRDATARAGAALARTRGSVSGESASPPGIGDATIEALERLGSLRDRGLLSDEEFAAEKRALLAKRSSA